MFHVRPLKNRFKLPVGDYNKIAEFLNNICGGLCINVKRPEKPSATNPPLIEIDRNDLAKTIKELTKPNEPQNPKELVSGGFRGSTGTQGLVPEASLSSKADDTWTASAAANAKGAKVKLLCRGADSGLNGALFWREFTIAPDGRLYSIGAEGDAMGVYTDQ